MPDAIDAWPGQPYPLGATYDGAGTNFSLFSEVAERVELCLFDEDGAERRLDLEEVDAFCRRSGPASVMATGCTGHGIPAAACAATQPSCCSIPMPRQSMAASTGRRPASPMTSATRTPRTATTAPRTCPGQWCTTRSSTGGTTGHPMSRSTSRSSTRSTSKDSRRGTLTSLRRSAVPTRG